MTFSELDIIESQPVDPVLLSRVVAVFADAGCVGKHPSTIGGTWAWCGVDATGWRIVEQSGGCVCDPGTRITTNTMEWYAVLRAMESMPDGWGGVVFTDSTCTITRLKTLLDAVIRNRLGSTLVPVMLDLSLYQRMVRAAQRLDLRYLEVRHLKGHPNADDLKRGYTVDGSGQRKYDVSPHQVWCDAECTRQKAIVRGVYDTREQRARTVLP